MNGTLHAITMGAKRGWHEQVLSLRSSQDQAFYLFWALVTLAYMYFNRDTVIEGIGLTIPQAALPTIFATAVGVALVIGPAQQIAMEREDGTVLRVLAAPRGSTAYATGQVVLNVTSLLPTFLVILIPAVVLFDAGSQRGWTGWVVGFAMLLLGVAAMLPLGLVIGSLVPDVRRTMTWGFLPIGLMVAISGIFAPLSSLWGWLQPIAQGMPLYWFAHGMRYAYLPDSAKALELHGEWQIPLALGVMALWAVLGWVAAIATMRRVGRGLSGASVVSARESATQYIR